MEIVIAKTKRIIRIDRQHLDFIMTEDLISNARFLGFSSTVVLLL